MVKGGIQCFFLYSAKDTKTDPEDVEDVDEGSEEVGEGKHWNQGTKGHFMLLVGDFHVPSAEGNTKYYRITCISQG